MKGEDGTGDDFQVSASNGYKAVVSGTIRQLHGVDEPGRVSSTGEHDDFEGLGRYVVLSSTWGLSWDHRYGAIGVLSFLGCGTARESSQPQKRERQRVLQSSRWRSDVTEQ